MTAFRRDALASLAAIVLLPAPVAYARPEPSPTALGTFARGLDGPPMAPSQRAAPIPEPPFLQMACLLVIGGVGLLRCTAPHRSRAR